MSKPTNATSSTSTEPDGTTPPAGTDGAEEFKAPTSKEELDKIIAAELAKFADYDELKGKAAKLDEAEQASKTELQRAQEAAQAAEKRAQEAEAKVTRAEVAEAKGVPASVLRGTTKEELEAHADEVLAALKEAATSAVSPKAPPPSANGAPINKPAGDSGDWLRDSLSKK